MDGQLTIIDGQPGRGKTLAAVELMLDSIRRGRAVATNIALKPAFAAKAIRINPAAIVMQLKPEEIKTYWKHTPANCDIFIDEAHLIWGSEEFRVNRSGNFKSYISQFRKDGDSIHMLAQNFENLDKFIRQRAETVIRCGRISWPKFLPKIGEKPIVFSINYYKVDEGDLGDRKNLIPRLFTPGMRTGIYQMYDTRGKVWTGDNEHEQITRPTFDSIRGAAMPDILTQNTVTTTGGPGAPGQPGTTQSLVTINQHPASKSKTPWIIGGIVGVIVILAMLSANKAKMTGKKKPKMQTKEMIAVKKKPDLMVYGRIGKTVYMKHGKKTEAWTIGETIAKITLLGTDINGAYFRMPNGMYQTIPYYTPPKKKRDKNKHKAAIKK